MWEVFYIVPIYIGSHFVGTQRSEVGHLLEITWRKRRVGYYVIF